MRSGGSSLSPWRPPPSRSHTRWSHPPPRVPFNRPAGPAHLATGDAPGAAATTTRIVSGTRITANRLVWCAEAVVGSCRVGGPLPAPASRRSPMQCGRPHTQRPSPTSLLVRALNSSGGRIRTYDLWVMSPASYRAAPPRAKAFLLKALPCGNGEQFTVLMPHPQIPRPGTA